MTTHLAIVMPGGGYGPLGPALRIPRLAAEESGAHTVEVVYPPAGSTSQEEERDKLRQATSDQIAAFISEAQPERITFIAKSLGTVLLSELPGQALPAAAEAIWLTPIFGQAAVSAGAINLGWPSLLVAGEADEYHKPARHNEVATALGASSVVLPRANHLLEVPGDLQATLNGFGLLASAVLEFLRQDRT